MINRTLGLAEALCEDPTYQTDYAGRMETCCRGCDNMEVNGKIRHGKKCIVVKARKIIKAAMAEMKP